MPTTLHVSGKHLGCPSVVAAAAGQKHYLYAWDCHSGRRFPDDTGAEISILPLSGVHTLSGKQGLSLTTVNANSIRTYGVLAPVISPGLSPLLMSPSHCLASITSRHTPCWSM